MTAKKGDWVQIYFIGLTPEQRAAAVPEDTKKVPLEVRIKGFLQNESADIGDMVQIETIIGRKVEGKLEEINPKHIHNFGEPVPELLTIGPKLHEILEGDDR